MNLIRRILHKIGIHHYDFLKFTNYYKSDVGFVMKCKICGKNKHDDGQPLM